MQQYSKHNKDKKTQRLLSANNYQTSRFTCNIILTSVCSAYSVGSLWAVGPAGEDTHLASVALQDPLQQGWLQDVRLGNFGCHRNEVLYYHFEMDAAAFPCVIHMWYSPVV